MKNSKFIFNVKSMFVAAAAAFFLSACADQEMNAVSQQVATSAEAATGPTAKSITITGANTTFVESVECATCTYVVSSGAQVVDGKELGLAPGSVICLDKAQKYGHIDFINLEGTAERPIVIGKCNNVAGS